MAFYYFCIDNTTQREKYSNFRDILHSRKLGMCYSDMIKDNHSNSSFIEHILSCKTRFSLFLGKLRFVLSNFKQTSKLGRTYKHINTHFWPLLNTMVFLVQSRTDPSNRFLLNMSPLSFEKTDEHTDDTMVKGAATDPSYQPCLTFRAHSQSLMASWYFPSLMKA